MVVAFLMNLASCSSGIRVCVGTENTDYRVF